MHEQLGSDSVPRHTRDAGRSDRSRKEPASRGLRARTRENIAPSGFVSCYRVTWMHHPRGRCPGLSELPHPPSNLSKARGRVRTSAILPDHDDPDYGTVDPVEDPVTPEVKPPGAGYARDLLYLQSRVRAERSRLQIGQTKSQLAPEPWRELPILVVCLGFIPDAVQGHRLRPA